jgi:hypothetical protein
MARRDVALRTQPRLAADGLPAVIASIRAQAVEPELAPLAPVGKAPRREGILQAGRWDEGRGRLQAAREPTGLLKRELQAEQAQPAEGRCPATPRCRKLGGYIRVSC